MKKLIILFSLALAGANLTGCHINVIRLDNRIEKWQSMKEKKKASAESMAKFANETIYFFLTTIDFQRSKEAVIDDAVRLRYHHKLTSANKYAGLSDRLLCQAGSGGDFRPGKRLGTGRS